jgi:hypothetical protein
VSNSRLSISSMVFMGSSGQGVWAAAVPGAGPRAVMDLSLRQAPAPAGLNDANPVPASLLRVGAEIPVVSFRRRRARQLT